MDAVTIILFVISIVGVSTSVYLFTRSALSSKTDLKDLTEEKALALASTKAKQKLEEAEKETVLIKEKALEGLKKLRAELAESEGLLAQREAAVQKRSRVVDEKAVSLEKMEEDLEGARAENKKVREKLLKKLEDIAGFTKEKAKAELLRKVDEDIASHVATKIKQAEEDAEDKSDETARRIIVDAIQRVSTDYSTEITTSVFKIDNDEIKGRIIGKEGRNIKTFEKLTGVDVIIDEEPGIVTLSSFDPLRREVASVALSKLIKDGRIQPLHIEEVIQKVKENIAIEIKKTGDEIALKVGWPNLHPDIKKLIGRYKYRYSYGQNLIEHTLEVVNIGKLLAAELGADAELVKRACLLHDLGKVLTHEIEKPHHHISGDIARKYGLPEKLVNAIEAHHLDIEPKSIEAWIVQIADSISGARPGARDESFDTFVKRMQELEQTAKDIVGDDKLQSVYAIKAGREIRVILNPKSTNDSETTKMAFDIARKLEETQNFPGEIKVSVIREFRATEVAK